MEIRKVSIDLIKPAEYNPRKDLKPGDEEYEKLKRSLQEFDLVEPLIWNERTGNLVGGHQRFKVLLDRGDKEVDVSVVNLSLEKEKALNLALNKIQGDWDNEKLAKLLEELKLSNIDIELTGFEVEEIDELISKFNLNDNEIEEDEVPDTPENPITKYGDIWQLGNHRLMCGDSTNKNDVEKLMDGKMADSMITDPPYGVDYSSKNEFLNSIDKGNRVQTEIINDNIKDYRKFFKDFLEAAILNEYNTVYVFISEKQILNLLLAMQDADYYVSTELVWVKNNHVLGRQDYAPRHENIVYGWKNKHKFYGMFSTTVIDETEIDVKKMKKEELIDLVKQLLKEKYEYSTVIYENKPHSNDIHPTMKPLKLVGKLIRDGSDIKSIIYDPFGGSGTTLIASEQLNRICYMMELDPKYCDVIIDRWEQYTGKKAVRISGEE